MLFHFILSKIVAITRNSKFRKYGFDPFRIRDTGAFFVPSINGLQPFWGWGKGTDNILDYELALSPPQFHFSKDTIKEFIIVFQNETVVKKPKFIGARHFIVFCGKYFFSVTFSWSF